MSLFLIESKSMGIPWEVGNKKLLEHISIISVAMSPRSLFLIICIYIIDDISGENPSTASK